MRIFKAILIGILIFTFLGIPSSVFGQESNFLSSEGILKHSDASFIDTPEMKGGGGGRGGGSRSRGVGGFGDWWVLLILVGIIVGLYLWNRYKGEK